MSEAYTFIVSTPWGTSQSIEFSGVIISKLSTLQVCHDGYLTVQLTYDFDLFDTVWTGVSTTGSTESLDALNAVFLAAGNTTQV